MVIIIKLTKKGTISFRDNLTVFVLSFMALFGSDVVYQYDTQELIKEFERAMNEEVKKKILEKLPQN